MPPARSDGGPRHSVARPFAESKRSHAADAATAIFFRADETRADATAGDERRAAAAGREQPGGLLGRGAPTCNLFKGG